jgi:hypothetical protein
MAIRQTTLQVIALKNLGETPRMEAVITKINTMNNVSANESLTNHHAKGAEISGRHTHSRLYATFAADFGQNLQIAHHIAEEDLQWRKDIHAYDAFAWATYRYWLLDPVAQKTEGNVLLREALVASQKAIALGTKDIEINEHAEEIAKAVKKM